ncbi:MAG: hypothetical protein WKF60_11185 [Ilumatobacter sp.]
MKPLFDSGPISIVIPDCEGSNGLQSLFLLEQAEMEVELGGEIVIAETAPTGGRTLQIEIDESEPEPRLVRDGTSVLRVRGPSLRGASQR